MPTYWLSDSQSRSHSLPTPNCSTNLYSQKSASHSAPAVSYPLSKPTSTLSS
ncbi:hypothetical protein HII31_01121 [Pseudocercospora fuligena]|uniref:Uncharacterized protein n=1 Tax=Pseudocercospora fuligena TaxID=685502 RepID=A0A8H6RVF3_9PEZI|nr:hypothetical protein HII31_01121 [Pseudocercospora fuligena]